MALRRTDPKAPLALHRDATHPQFEMIETFCAAMRATFPTALLEAALDRWERLP